MRIVDGSATDGDSQLYCAGTCNTQLLVFPNTSGRQCEITYFHSIFGSFFCFLGFSRGSLSGLGVGRV